MTPSVPVITVDGPSGVGKGTLCRFLATRLGWHFLDSGALYRLAALAALRRQVDLHDGPRLAALAAQLDARFVNNGEQETHIFLDGEDVSVAIRSEDCGNAASQVAAIPALRAALLQRQRDFRQLPGLVADGRDMGTVVFPDAQVKIFLTASPRECAARRHNQLKEKGIHASLLRLEQEIIARDERDANRQVAPLKPAADAQELDTTGLDIEQVRACALTIVGKQFKLS